MKIVAIAGSPVKHGNSTSLMKVALDAASERGATAKIYHAVEMNISGCRGCHTCHNTPDSVCRLRDDMHAVYAAIKSCDALLLASPVYFYGVSSWLKTVIDRCFALLDPPEPPEGYGETGKPEPRVAPGKALYLITTQHASWPMYGYQILSTVANGFKWLGMQCRGEIIATGLGDSGDWKERPDLVEAAARLIDVRTERIP